MGLTKEQADEKYNNEMEELKINIDSLKNLIKDEDKEYANKLFTLIDRNLKGLWMFKS